MSTWCNASSGRKLLSTWTDVPVFLPLPRSGGDERSVSHHRLHAYLSWSLTILTSVAVSSFISAVNCVILLLVWIIEYDKDVMWVTADCLRQSSSSNPRWMHLAAGKSWIILSTVLNECVRPPLNQLAYIVNPDAYGCCEHKDCRTLKGYELTKEQSNIIWEDTLVVRYWYRSAVCRSWR
jgi:hypothetical protein